jgi:PAS domain S-box-containing protein
MPVNKPAFFLVAIVMLLLLVVNWVQPTSQIMLSNAGQDLTASIQDGMTGIPDDMQNQRLNLVLMIANGLIAAAYASIPVSLVVFIVKRRDIPFSWVFVLFGAFILACGTTHALHVVGIWNQTSMTWGQAVADSLTAVVSVFSAVVIWPLLPKILSIPSPAQLRAVNQDLEKEKANLVVAQRELRHAYAEVEQRVVERTAELLRTNRDLQKEIGERQQVEDALSESEERYRTLFNSMTEGFALHELVFDANGQPCDYRFLDINPSFEQLTGLKKADLVGNLQSHILPGEDPFWLQTYSQVAITGESAHIENYSPVLQKYYDVIAYCPAPFQFAVIVMDITARKQAESEREHLLAELERKNRDLESMVYIASHDLRSPLVNVQGFSASLRKYVGQIVQILGKDSSLGELRAEITPILTERIPKALGFIESSSSKMDSLINGLLRLSRIGRAQFQPELLDMERLIQAISDTSAFQIEKVGARIIVQSPLLDCRADRQQLSQVFSNLIDNAIKYRDKDRPLIISISSRAEGKRVIYTVADNGIGISAENIDKVWELFRRLEIDDTVQGEGLGLTIARRIVERHNGRIWVESEEYSGSRFHVELPR